MTSPTPSRGLSRRALFALAGSAAVLASVAAAWRARTSDAEAAPSHEDGAIGYADYHGWMVTPAEKAALTAAPPAPPPAAGPR